MKRAAPRFPFASRRSTWVWSTAMVAVSVCAFVGGRFSQAKVGPTRVGAAADSRSSTVLPTLPTEHVNAAPASTTASALSSRWMDLRTCPQSSSTEAALAKVIEELAQSDPQRAISMSVDQTNLRLRTTLLRAALRGWGRSHPEAAAVWADAQTTIERTDAIDTVLQGALSNPDGPLKVMQTLSGKGSAHEAEDGGSVIAALAESGQFERAAALAGRGNPTYHEEWMLRAYCRWAEFQPTAAVEHALKIDEPLVRDFALNSVIAGWARTDPQQLIEFAATHFASDRQNTAVANAMSHWASVDPVGAAAWLSQNDPGAPADTGIAEIALSSPLAQKPQIAASWAEIISNPQLRLETVRSVLANWPREDIASARNFLVNCRGLQPEERTQLSAGLETIE